MTTAPGPALGARGQDRLRQAARRQAAQVRPQERALPDEPERHSRKRLTNTKVGPLLSASPRPSGRRTASACWPSSAARTPATRSPSTPDRRPEAARQDRATASRASSAPRSPATGPPCSAPPAASNPAPNHRVATIPYGGGKMKAWSRTPTNPTGASERRLAVAPAAQISRAGRPGAGSRRCRSRRPCA